MITTLAGLVLLINSHRAAPLTVDPLLSTRAQERAEFLCASGQWSHAGWGKSFKDMPAKRIGENLAKGFPSFDAADRALMNSPSHKANIVDSRYSRVGVGKACNIIVELFIG